MAGRRKWTLTRKQKASGSKKILIIHLRSERPTAVSPRLEQLLFILHAFIVFPPLITLALAHLHQE